MINTRQNLLEPAKFQTLAIFLLVLTNLQPQLYFSESAIGQHLLDNPICAKNYSDEKFTILSFSRSSFHLSALEAVYIKSCKPNLCRQVRVCLILKQLR